MGKNISKNVRDKYIQARLNTAKNLSQMHLKLLQREQFKESRSNW